MGLQLKALLTPTWIISAVLMRTAGQKYIVGGNHPSVHYRLPLDSIIGDFVAIKWVSLYKYMRKATFPVSILKNSHTLKP